MESLRCTSSGRGADSKGAAAKRGAVLAVNGRKEAAWKAAAATTLQATDNRTLVINICTSSPDS